MNESHLILIVDDDEIDRMAVRRSLLRTGQQWEVYEAATSETAFEQIRTRQFECIFLDYRLKGETGLTFLENLRQSGNDTPVIVITSHGDEKIAVEVMKAGGSDYIAKEMINPEGIAQVLRNAIRTHKAELERQSAQKALRKSQQLLAEAQRMAGMGSWEINLNTLQYTWSPQVYELFGYEQDEIQPNFDLFLKFLKKEQRQEVKKAVEKSLRDGLPFQLDVELTTQASMPQYVEIHGRPEKDSAGRIYKLIGSIQDITARINAQKALITARDLAQDAVRAREEFLANISHEIRTPMNAVLGFSGQLKRSELDNEQHGYLDALTTAAETLMSILDDLLIQSSLKQGLETINLSRFTPQALLNELNLTFRSLAKEKGVDFDTELDQAIPEILIGDKGKISRVLMNLVRNALKFTESGKISLQISLIGKQNEHLKIRFQVSDTGIGIPPEKLESIFYSFRQGEGQATRQHGGLGLGLQISQRLAKLLDSELKVESKPEQGSRFWFELHLLPADNEGQSAPGSAKATPQKAPRILLVEDNKLNQKLAMKILEQLNYRSELAEHGLRALEKLEEGEYDLVLMDIQMPYMDGYEATRKIRSHQNPTINQLPILALTAHFMPGEREKATSAGMNGYLTKPFQPEQLQEKIEAILAAPQIQEAQPKVVKFDQLDEMAAGNLNFRHEIIRIFLEEVPLELAQMEKAIKAENWEALRRSKHKVGPSFELFKVQGWPEEKAKLEAQLKTQPNASKFEESLQNLHRIAAEAIKALKEELK